MSAEPRAASERFFVIDGTVADTERNILLRHGEVVKLEAGRVVLTHQAIAALNWPTMTMPFQLATPDLAEGLKPGLKLEAQFEPVNGDAPRIVSWKAMP